MIKVKWPLWFFDKFKCLCKLKALEDKNRRQVIQLDHGAAPVPRKRVYRDIDTCLLRLKDHLQLGRKTPLEFLDAVSHLLKMHL